jgi:hypothetical protein
MKEKKKTKNNQNNIINQYIPNAQSKSATNANAQSKSATNANAQSKPANAQTTLILVNDTKNNQNKSKIKSTNIYPNCNNSCNIYVNTNINV